MLATQALRANELGIGGDDAVQASSTAEMLQAFDMNVDDNANNINALDWKDDADDHSRRISEW